MVIWRWRGPVIRPTGQMGSIFAAHTRASRRKNRVQEMLFDIGIRERGIFPSS